MRKVSYFYLTWLYAFSTLTVYLRIGYGAYVRPLLMNVFNWFCVNKLFQAFSQQLLSLSSLADTNQLKNHLSREEMRKAKLEARVYPLWTISMSSRRKAIFDNVLCRK